VLKLARGGELRICPKTSLSLSADAAGKALALGLNTGAMELDYSLAGATDLLLTPDFRLQLISPGNFHIAVSVAANGDTCLRSLAGNDAAVFVSETMGTDSYQLSPGKNVMFKEAKISGATEAPAVCGCPERAPELVAGGAEPAPESTAQEWATLDAKPKGAKETVEPENRTDTDSDPARNEAGNVAGNVAHMEVDSSFVYRGNEAVQDYYGAVARLSLSTDNSKLALALLPEVSGPPQAEAKPAAKKESRLRRFRKFLGGLFGD
jgi:hypothetical protein